MSELPSEHHSEHRPELGPQQRPEGRSRLWVWLLVGGGVFVLFVAAIFTLVYFSFGGTKEATFSGFGSKIAVVELDGVCFSEEVVTS